MIELSEQTKKWALRTIFLIMDVVGTGTLAAGQVVEYKQGQLAGVNAALTGLMSMLGPLWAGAAYDHVASTAPYWMGVAILVIACILLKQVKTKPHEINASSQPSTFNRDSQMETGD